MTSPLVDRRRAEEVLGQEMACVRLLQLVAVAANETSSVHEVAQTAVDAICALTGWPVGHLYLRANGAGSDLVPTGVWHLEDPERFVVFRTTTEATSFPAGVGLLGQVASAAEPIWYQDISVEPGFLRAPQARQAGITMGFAFPVVAGRDVVGVLEFFATEANEPDERLIDGIAQAVAQLGRVAERGSSLTALRRSEARVRAILEAASDAFVAMDAGGSITDWNSRAEVVFGWSAREAIGRLLADTIIPAQHREAHQRGLERFLVSGEGPVLNRRIEITALHRDGHQFPVELAIWAVEADGTHGFNAFITDITVRRQGDELRSQLSSIVESSDDAIIGKGLDGTILSWNGGAERLYGWRAEEIVGRPIGILVPPDCSDEVPGILARIRSGEKVDHYETVRVTKDGRRVEVSLTISPTLDGNGDVVGASTIARGIGDRKRLESELAAASKQAVEASRLKSEFLANMSHEIRTPMNGVIGMAGLLLDTDLSVEQREYAQTIRRSGDALLSVINDILDFSKIESGHVDLEVIDFDLCSAMEEVGVVLADRAFDKGLELCVTLDPDVPTALRGDPGRLRQVLINLVGNAVKFTEAGEVVARASLERRTSDAVMVRFEVVDTGVGIDTEHQDRLFASFSQADASTTRRYGGTGLGLAISKQLAELMGGSIGFHSQPGEGSTFWFTVWLTEGSKASSPPPADPETMRGTRVLVVDDNSTNRLLLEQTLLTWGIQPDCAASGAQALVMLRTKAGTADAYALAILDYKMPGMDGIELARAISVDPSIAATRVVLLTSAGQRGDAQASSRAGIKAYLTKPVRQSLLHDSLATVMGARAAKAAAPLVTRHSLAEARTTARHVLVVEDNPVNQEVAVRMLQKLGHRVEVAGNGLEALAAVAQVLYDLILMDCQMPEMDGYQATSHIRRLQGPAARTPIIALTAGAMTGDEQRALAAGMDDYVTKPVQLERVAEVVGRWARDPARPASAPVPKAPALDPAVLADLRELTAQAGHGLATLATMFVEQADAALDRLRTAVTDGDLHTIASVTHGLRGSAGCLGASGVADLCIQLEKLASDANVSAARQVLRGIETELGRVRRAFEDEVNYGG